MKTMKIYNSHYYSTATRRRRRRRVNNSFRNSNSVKREEEEEKTQKDSILPLLEMPDDEDGDEKRKIFVRDLRDACSSVGFFYLKPSRKMFSTEKEIFELANAFFALPIEEKMRIDYANSAQFRGYVSLGLENTKGKIDAREQIEFGVHRKEIDKVTNFYERLVGPNQYPSQIFEQTIGAFIEEMDAISRQLTKYLALSLDQNENYFDDMFVDPNMQMKICKYPPISEPSTGFGVGKHTDSGFFSILLQDDVGGLQIAVDDQKQEWIDASPVDGYFVVNIGEMLEMISNSNYRATPHRVLSPKDRPRISVPYFWNPRLDFVAKELIKTEISNDDDNKLINVYGENAFKSLARSHPKVFGKHHPDLIVKSDGTMEFK